MADNSWEAHSKVYVLQNARDDLIRYADWSTSKYHLQVLDQVIQEYQEQWEKYL